MDSPEHVRKPAVWSDPSKKPFPYQVGFTCPPQDFDAAPTDFLRMAPETVGVHGRMLHIPGYCHQLDQRKRHFQLLEEFVECMASSGADVCAQVGSNWVHASGFGVSGIRDYCRRLSETYETPFHMAGYAMVEALRALDVEKVALNAVYHWPDWWQGTVRFLRDAGFDVTWAGNFVDQGWFPDQATVNDQRWIFDGDLACRSFLHVAEQAGPVDAYLANGMCNFRRESDGLPQRLVALEVELESILGRPVVTHDNALYWRVFRTLGLAPVTRQGKLLSSLCAVDPR
ncbi:MAG: hypothetical protein OXI81_13715 [Paracoccaceae bacterium]|nr:hypothetical protein [Paracoccaceae bacterium]MDE2915018.1 hypothetical protein [Paracoccaceae bacterium]